MGQELVEGGLWGQQASGRGGGRKPTLLASRTGSRGARNPQAPESVRPRQRGAPARRPLRTSGAMPPARASTLPTRADHSLRATPPQTPTSFRTTWRVPLTSPPHGAALRRTLIVPGAVAALATIGTMADQQPEARAVPPQSNFSPAATAQQPAAPIRSVATAPAAANTPGAEAAGAWRSRG